MQLEFLKSFWTWSSGAPKFARVAGKNVAWLRQHARLSLVIAEYREGTHVGLFQNVPG